MADFEVNTNGVLNCANAFDQYSKSLSAIAEESSSILSQLRGSISARVSGAASRIAIYGSAKACQADMSSLGKAARQATQIYLRYENNTENRRFSSSGTGKHDGNNSGNPSSISLLLKLLSILQNGALNPISLIGRCGVSLLHSEVFDWVTDNIKLKFTDEKAIYELNMKKYFGEKDGFDKMQGKIGANLNFGKGVHAFEASTKGNSKYADGSASVGIGNAEWSAKGFAGSGYYKDKDGNLKWASGVDAHVGGSASLLEANAQGRLGLGENHDLLGVNGSGEVSVGKVGAEAGGSVGFFDGEFQGYVGASAEAKAAEAKGSIGVTVAGTDFKVNGGVNIGVGAHANVGFKEGKFKVDVGASIGLGVNIGFEVDVSGTVNYIKKGLKKLF